MLLSIVAQAQQSNIETFEIDSKQLNEKCIVKVALPAFYHQATKSYPLIIVLDNQLIFPTMTAIASQLSATARMPESIVVTINANQQYTI